jgi:hypothetical protein
MDAIKINAYVDAYYKTNQAHVAWSFWTSLVALAVGLFVVIVGIGLALSGSSPAISIVTTSAGVLTQFISAGFFYLYNKNLKQLNVFYRELVQNQDMLFALGLVGHIPESERPRVVEGLIGKLLSRNSPATEITPELILALAESKSAASLPPTKKT